MGDGSKPAVATSNCELVALQYWLTIERYDPVEQLLTCLITCMRTLEGCWLNDLALICSNLAACCCTHSWLSRSFADSRALYGGAVSAHHPADVHAIGQ